MSVETRDCSDCGEKFPLTSEHFHRSSRSKDGGFQFYCKRCSAKRKRVWRAVNRKRDALNRKLLRGGAGVRAERQREGWSEAVWERGAA